MNAIDILDTFLLMEKVSINIKTNNTERLAGDIALLYQQLKQFGSVLEHSHKSNSIV